MLEQNMHYAIIIASCICFLVFIYAGKNTPVKGFSHYFVVGTLAILAVIFSEMVEIFYAPPRCMQVTWQRWTASIIAYILRPGVAFLLLLILLHGRKKKHIVLAALPLMINTVFLLISPLCGVVFTYTDTNSYSGGPLKYLPFAVGAVYLAAFLLFGLMLARRDGFAEAFAVFFIVLLCGLAVWLESEFSLMGSLPTAGLIGMIFYYVYFYMDCYSKDQLTGAYQRNRFYQDAEREIPRYFIMFDVNGLKRINDNQGHIAGDTALRAFGKTVYSVLPRQADFYRIGGDEFVILYPKASEDDVKRLLQKINEGIDSASLPYGVSCGFAKLERADELNAAYRLADEMLYKQKDCFWGKYRKGTQEGSACRETDGGPV